MRDKNSLEENHGLVPAARLEQILQVAVECVVHGELG